MKVSFFFCVSLTIISCHQSTYEERLTAGMMKKLSEHPTKDAFAEQLYACTISDEFLDRHPDVKHQCRDITAPAIYKITREIELEKPGSGCRNILTSLVTMKKNEKWAYDRCCSGIMKSIGDCKDIGNFTSFHDPDAKLTP